MTGDAFAHVVLLLALVLMMAKVGGEIATRLGQPPVLGELLAGILLGNLPFGDLPGLGANPYIDLLARFGVLILLFEVGLESTVADVLAVGVAAARVAVLGTVFSFALGFGVARIVAPDAGLPAHVFVGAAITATSIGITARVLKDLGKTRTKEARTILGAAVLDDIIGLVVLALVSGFFGARASREPMGVLAIGWVLVKTLGFLAIAIVVSMRVTPRLFRFAARLRTGGVLLAIGLSFCFFLSWAAEAIGLASLVGAFAAGLVLEDAHSSHFVARGERSLAQLVEPISEFLVPVFFLVMGIRADVRVLVQPSTLLLAGALTIAAVVGKLACGLGTARGVDRLGVALGMIPRGEVTLIFASLGLTLLDKRTYSALVTVVVLTTLLTPAALKWSFGRARAA
ncbi:MAG TPA: cation:proton antiporter [Labilithrix sp.]|jgi:Kef-type K+ transport system membrane component KefB